MGRTVNERELSELLAIPDAPLDPPDALSDEIRRRMEAELAAATDDERLSARLRAADGPHEPPYPLSRAIQERMQAELAAQAPAHENQAADQPIPVEVQRQAADESPSRPIRRWVIAAAAAAAILVASVLPNDRADDPDQPVAVTAPPPYLRACADFQQAASLDGRGWKSALDDLVDDPRSIDYLTGVALALDQLITVPAVAPARGDLTAAADLARSEPTRAVVEDLSERLHAARDLLVQATGHGCLDNRTATTGAD